MEHIKEYVAEDVIEVVNEISLIINLNDLKESVNVAKELFVSVATLNSVAPEESTCSLREEIYEQEQKLTHQLHSALTVLHEQGLEHIQQQVPLIDLEALHKMVNIAENLESDLNVAIISQPSIIDIETPKDTFAESVKESATDKQLTTDTQEASVTEINKISDEIIHHQIEEYVPLEVQETSIDTIQNNIITKTEQPSTSTEDIKVNVALESTFTLSVDGVKELHTLVAETGYPQDTEQTISSEKVNVTQESAFNIIQESTELPEEMSHDVQQVESIDLRDQVLITTQDLEKVLAESQLQEVVENVGTLVNKETKSEQILLLEAQNPSQVAFLVEIESQTQLVQAEKETMSQTLDELKDLHVEKPALEEAVEVFAVPLDKALVGKYCFMFQALLLKYIYTFSVRV